LGAFDTDFTHQLLSKGVTFKSSGRLVHAPGRKVLFELHIQVADGTGHLRLISDGTTIYRVRQVGEDKSVTTCTLERLDKAREDLKDPGDLDAAVAQELIEDLMAEHGFTGITTILRDARKRMSFQRHESTSLRLADGKSLPVYMVEGEWTKESLRAFLPPKGPEPNAKDPQKQWDEREEYAMVPRKCRIYLHRDGGWPWTDSLWPVRIEWIGPAKPRGSDVVITATDFTIPKRATPPDSLFALTAQEAELKPQEFDVEAMVKQRKASRQRAQESLDRSTTSPITPPATTTPGKQ
jgi:hypothetical protein